ncbi:hypothetical protein [Altererythrobacter sp. MF3-039]|uniref:hypothetical protein n=1 Tax=Altererythrobacter sp. MF3-039 TaxID=3252901 RepID=UPI00390C7635
MAPRILLPLVILAAVSSPAAAQEAAQGEGLSRADFIAQMDAEFRNLDIDSSGVVLPEEIVATQRAAAQAEAFRQNQAVFANLDQDANGQLSPQEFAALANPDAIAVSADPLLQQFDTDKDGAITLVEYRIATQANFDRIDTDRDGVVTPVEMQAAGIVR